MAISGYNKAMSSQWEGKMIADIQTTSIRIPTDLHNKLRKIAKHERRSISQQILLYVENQMRANGQFPESEHFPEQENSDNQEIDNERI